MVGGLELENEVITLIKDIHSKRSAGQDENKIFLEFKEAMKNLIVAHRVSAREVVIKVLEDLTDEGKLIDPSILDRDINIWRWCWAAFFELGDFVSADRVIEDCYLHLLKLQLKNNKRYHKGMPLQTRAEGFIKIGRYDKAKKFVLLAHIEDMITGLPSAPAWQTLKLAGISEQDLKLVEEETNNLVKECSRERVFYPEEVLHRVQYKLEFGSIGELSKASVFTNPIFLEELLIRVESASQGSDTNLKRKSMENLAQYLFSSVEGLYVKPSTRAGPYELDGIITNISPHPFLKTLDTYIPIECKNWKKPIGAPEITKFIGKLSLFKCNYGILLSKKGLKAKTVNELRKDACRRNGIYVLVFNEDDIKSIIEGRDLLSLLIEKFEELKFAIKM
jgi:hypothetical protein